MDVGAMVTSDAVVPPDGTGGRRTWRFRHISVDEIRALNRETREGNYRRFFLIGYVVYDDFFDQQHTTHFCLKLRQHGFHAPKGGRRYNYTERRRAPKRDALAAEAADDTA